MILSKLLIKAFEYRQGLKLGSNAMRLVNGAGDGLDGLLIDLYNKHVHIQFLKEHWRKHKEEIKDALMARFPVEYLIVKTRRGIEFQKEILIPGHAKTVVQEQGLNFAVDLEDGLNSGLFLDMRQNRKLVREAGKNKKVLNCFSYTCAFGLQARAGGAQDVINVDISRKSLDQGKHNYQLNSLPFSGTEFMKADVRFFIERALKKGTGFDIIILDPPSFSRQRKETFQAKRDLPALTKMAAAVLNPGGHLLLATNYSAIRHADLEQILSRSLQGRKVERIQRLGQDEDFKGSNSFKESYLAGLWVKFL